MALTLPDSLPAQGSNVLSVAEPQKVTLRRDVPTVVKLDLSIRDGYHVNSDMPDDPYLIPLKLTWSESVVKVQKVEYPKAQKQTFEFNPKPLSVFAGNFQIATTLVAPRTAPAGPNVITAKLRYQACSDTACLPPKTIDVKLPVIIQ